MYPALAGLQIPPQKKKTVVNGGEGHTNFCWLRTVGRNDKEQASASNVHGFLDFGLCTTSEVMKQPLTLRLQLLVVLGARLSGSLLCLFK